MIFNNLTNQSHLSVLNEALSDVKITVSGKLNPTQLHKLVLSDLWPRAAQPNRIITTEEQRISRAKKIVGSLGNLYCKKVLDFGCERGHVAKAAAQEGAEVVGYDVVLPPVHPVSGCTFTNEWETVADKGPYDIIICYDVIDHIMTQELLDTALFRLRKVCKGTMVVICHPHTSRHGDHNYLSLNKAYAGLLLPDEILQGYERVPVRAVDRPIDDYVKVFSRTGWVILAKDDLVEPLEPIIKDPEIQHILSVKLGKNLDWIARNLPITFVNMKVRPV